MTIDPPPSPPVAQTDPEKHTEAFLRHFAAHQEDLRRYIFSLVMNKADADDAFQETCVALWRKYYMYDPNRPFINWACRFARIQSLKLIEKRGRRPSLVDETILDLLSNDFDHQRDELEERRHHLRNCLAKLSKEQIELLRCRYASKETIADTAKRTGRSAKALYKSLERIRTSLYRCVSQQLDQVPG